jgi:hypothetical protein
LTGYFSRRGDENCISFHKDCGHPGVVQDNGYYPSWHKSGSCNGEQLDEFLALLKPFPILAYVAPIKVRNYVLGFKLRVSTEPIFLKKVCYGNNSTDKDMFN